MRFDVLHEVVFPTSTIWTQLAGVELFPDNLVSGRLVYDFYIGNWYLSGPISVSAGVINGEDVVAIHVPLSPYADVSRH